MAAKKRILIFSLAYHPFVGGAEAAVKEITDRIDLDEVEFHMVTLRFDSTLPSEERLGNIVVHRIGLARHEPSATDLKRFPLHLNKFLYQVYAPLVAYRLHKKESFDGVWAIMSHAAGVPAVLFNILHPSVPFALTLQEGDPVEHIKRMALPVWPLFKRSFTRARVVQAISQHLADFAVSMGHPRDVVVIPNGVDATHFAASIAPEERERIRSELGASKDDTLLITTSRLVHKNGLDDVIRALSSLPKRVRFAVLGTGPLESSLRALADCEKVTERVVFLGHIDHDTMPAYLHAGDIFIRPSRSEGLGSSFIEAMAAGLPVIATQVGGIKDFLFDSERDHEREATGYAVDPDAPEQIAQAVKRIEKDPQECERTVSRAQRIAVEEYDWGNIAKAMNDRVFATLGE